MKALLRSSEIRAEIIKLFSSKNTRRVAVVAFVGDGAEAYLPNPKGLELICWPRAGGTNPNALRRLMKRGANISFVDALHMKLYWSASDGAIVTSANLSTNALGAGNLKEIGVVLPTGSIDIDSLISRLNPRPVSSAELRELDRLHNLYVIKNKNDFRRARPKELTYAEWYESTHRVEWRLSWWDTSFVSASKSAKEITRRDYGKAEPHWAQECKRREFAEGDWTLSFRLSPKGATGIAWMFVDYVVNLSPVEKKRFGYPCEAVQVWPPNRYPERPFRIDSRFRTAFSAAVREYEAERIINSRTAIPKESLLEAVYLKYRRLR
jgi:hypothetical protein